MKKDDIKEILEFIFYSKDDNNTYLLDRRNKKSEVLENAVFLFETKLEQYIKEKVKNEARELLSHFNRGKDFGMEVERGLTAKALGRAGFKQSQVDRYVKAKKKINKEYDTNGKVKTQQGDFQETQNRSAKKFRKSS